MKNYRYQIGDKVFYNQIYPAVVSHLDEHQENPNLRIHITFDGSYFDQLGIICHNLSCSPDSLTPISQVPLDNRKHIAVFPHETELMELIVAHGDNFILPSFKIDDKVKFFELSPHKTLEGVIIDIQKKRNGFLYVVACLQLDQPYIVSYVEIIKI